VFSVVGKSEHSLHISNYSSTCDIAAICVLPDGQVLVADSYSKKVILLNHQYQVVSHCDVSACPWDICQITHSEVAVAVHENVSNTYGVKFITVNQSQLVPVRKFKLHHSCYSIAHQQDDLFISSYTTLFYYLFSGILVSKLYEDVSGRSRGKNCGGKNQLFQ
jgi:hypothetical protein